MNKNDLMCWLFGWGHGRHFEIALEHWQGRYPWRWEVWSFHNPSTDSTSTLYSQQGRLHSVGSGNMCTGDKRAMCVSREFT